MSFDNYKPEGLRQRAWWVMRRSKKFTLVQLLSTVTTELDKNPEKNLRAYLNGLVKAGLVRITRKPSGAARRTKHIYEYTLLIDGGRKNPSLRKNGEVYDLNTYETYPAIFNAKGQPLTREPTESEAGDA